MANAVDLAIRVTSDARQAAASLDTTTTKASKMGKVGAASGKLLAVGLLAAGAAALKCANMAAEDQASASKMAQAFRQAAGATDAQVKSTEDWITAQGKALGVADDQLRPALTSLVTATKDVGKSQKLAKIAMDVSARSGKSLQSVSNALAKAYTTGNVAALAKYGVATKDAKGNTRSLEAVTRDLAKTYKGSAADAANTIAGKTARAKLQFSEMAEAIGYKLIPIMLTASNIGLQAVDWIDQNQRVVAVLAVALGSLLAVTWAVSKAMQAWAAISKVITAAQWALNVALNANPVSLIVIAVIALVAALVLAYRHSDRFRAIVDAAFRVAQKAAEAAFNWIRGHWRLLFVILTGPIGLAVLTIIKYRTQIMNAIGAVVGWVRAHWKALFVILTGPIGLAVLTIIKHRDKITAAIRAAIDFVREHWSTISGILTAPFDTAAAAAQKVVDLIEKISSKIRSIPTPHLPDLNPLNRSSARGKGDYLAGSSSSSSRGGGDIYYIDMTGLLDTNQAADRLIKLLNKRTRRGAGGRVVLT